MEKKAKLATTNATGKRQLETEVAELKDQVDLKERKISLLQRKVRSPCSHLPISRPFVFWIRVPFHPVNKKVTEPQPMQIPIKPINAG